MIKIGMSSISSIQRALHLPSGITVRYVYSACVVVESPDVAVLCDPWFSDGIYDGSWYQFPKIADPIGIIGDVDFVWISHIHPDHYDPAFLHKYMKHYGEKPVMVARREFPYLEQSLRSEGFAVISMDEPHVVGTTSITALAVHPQDRSEIDSALHVEFRNAEGRRHSVLNVNDIIFDEHTLSEMSSQFYRPDVLLLGYTGAGPYPQTYFDISDPRLPDEAERKKLEFFDRYRRNIAAFDAAINIPFAGKYLLGGSRTTLNSFRGVADAVEILDFDERSVVLADSGGQISTSDKTPRGIRIEKYSEENIVARCNEIAGHQMVYELIDESFIDLIPFERILKKAHAKALTVSPSVKDYFFVFELSGGNLAILNTNPTSTNGFSIVPHKSNLPEPRSEIYMDNRYLFGLLTGVFHWNNAEVGSQFSVRRTPNLLNREAQRFLNFLSL